MATRREIATADEVEGLVESRRARLLRPLLGGGMELFVRLRGIEWVPRTEPPTERPCILAANHQSHADTPAVLACLSPEHRRRTVVAAASDTFYRREDGGPLSPGHGLLHHLAVAVYRAYPFERRGSARRSLRVSAHLLERGWSILLFPAGTRGAPEDIGPFQPGVGWLAARTGAPVVPVHVAGGAGILPPGAAWPRPGRIHVRFGAPLSFTPSDEAPDVATRIERAVRGLAPTDGPGALRRGGRGGPVGDR